MWQQNPYHHSFAPKPDILETIVDTVFEALSERKSAIRSKILGYNSLA